MAAKKLATLTSDVNTAVTRDLIPGLVSSSGMGGDYPEVAGWNANYHMHGGDVRSAIVNYAGALAHFGDVLAVAGYNWDTAEHNANMSGNKGSPPPLPTLGTVNPVGANGFPDVPDPSGDNGVGVVIMITAQRMGSWSGAPNGRAAALDAAATAWGRFAHSDELVNAVATLRAVRDSFAGIQAPEVPDILEALDALRGGAEQIGTVAAILASVTRAHHDNLLDVRKQLCTVASGAFPRHPGAEVTATSDDTVVRISVAAEPSDVDVTDAEKVLIAAARNAQRTRAHKIVRKYGQ